MINFHTDKYNAETMTMVEVRQLWAAMASIHYAPTREAFDLSVILNKQWGLQHGNAQQ